MILRNERLPIGNVWLNYLLVSIVLGGTLFQLFGLPLIAHRYGIVAAFGLLPIMLLQPLHWGLIHEAIHSHLFPKRHANELGARLLSVVHGLPFDGTRVCHLVHHRFSRHGYDRPDIYTGRAPHALIWLGYRLRLIGGVYLGLLAASLIAFLPVPIAAHLMTSRVPIAEDGDTEVRRVFEALARNPSKRRRTRREFAIALALYSASAWLYGAWWPMLLASMSLRGIWHSIADNIPHHAVALNEPERARNHSLPRVLQFLVLNHHLHLTHHRFPRVPWGALGALSEAAGDRPHSNYFRAAFRQFDRHYPARTSLISRRPIQSEVTRASSGFSKPCRISQGAPLIDVAVHR